MQMEGSTAPYEVGSALAVEDLQYWAAHPELPALLAHFQAKVLEARPKEVRAFARELFSQEDLQDQVHKAMSRNGGVFNDGQRKAPPPVKLNRGERSKKKSSHTKNN